VRACVRVFVVIWLEYDLHNFMQMIDVGFSN